MTGLSYQHHQHLDPAPVSSRHRDHLAAVQRTLGWADEAAGGGDYVGALAWLDAVEAIGDRLPEPYGVKRRAWLTVAARRGSEGVAGR